MAPINEEKAKSTGKQTKVSRKRRMMSMENIVDTKRKKCCRKNCLNDILTLQDLVVARSEFWERDREEQGQ